MAEHPAVNRRVVSSSLTCGVFRKFGTIRENESSRFFLQASNEDERFSIRAVKQKFNARPVQGPASVSCSAIVKAHHGPVDFSLNAAQYHADTSAQLPP